MQVHTFILESVSCLYALCYMQLLGESQYGLMGSTGSYTRRQQANLYILNATHFIFILMLLLQKQVIISCMSQSLVLSISVSQTAPCWHPNKPNPIPPTCTSSSIKFYSLSQNIILAKLLIINGTILLNYQSSVGVSIGCEVQLPTVWLKLLFFSLLLFFLGLKSSALNWSEPSGHRLRCIQNFNAPFSIV